MGEAPDLVLTNGRIITLCQDRPWAQAVAAKDGNIFAVGSTREILALAAPRTTVIDCHGRCVVPGFHDAHIHLLACAAKRLSLDCSPPAVHSIRQIQQLIYAHAQTTPAGTWIRAGNYDEFQLAEHRHPTRRDLDIVAPLHPVKLQHRSLRACVLNSAALKNANLDIATDRPSVTLPGVRIDIDLQTNQPSGLVYDYTGYLGQLVPPFPEAALRSSLRTLLSDLVTHGITSIQDATFRNGLAEWNLFSELYSIVDVRPRLDLMIGWRHFGNLLDRGIQAGSCNEWLNIGAVKFLLTETSGSFEPDPDTLGEQVWQAHQHGFQVAIHAVEESEICVAADALARPMCQDSTRHHRIEHCSVLPPGLCERLAEAQITVCTQPAFICESGDRYLVDVEAHRQPFLYAIKRLIDAGIVVGAGSDAPVATFNPLVGIGAAVTRQSRRGDIVGENEAVSVEQALRLYTSGSAYICREQDRKGSIKPGKLADLVVLSEDLTAVNPSAIRDIQVEATIIGGRVVWRRES